MPHSNLHTQKRRTNRAILIVLFAFCALLFVLTLIKMTAASGGDQVNANYDVPAAYQICAADSDCVLVSTVCNGCCDRGAIRQDSVSVFEKERGAHCVGYDDPVCDCVQSSATAACVTGRCTAVVLPEPSIKVP